MDLGDMAGLHRERDAEAGEKLLTSRRGGSENQRRSAALGQRRVAQETMSGFLSVMTRSFFARALVRNLGRLKECRCAAPFQ